MEVLNQYLMAVWFEKTPRPQVCYIDSRIAGAFDTPEHLRELYLKPRFRELYMLPPPPQLIPLVPLVFVVRHNWHFFTVIMDIERRAVHVLGRTDDTNTRDNWDQWRGPDYFRHLCLLHGWDAGDTSDVIPYAVTWHLNGYDCGPLAINTTEFMFREGICLEPDGKLQEPALQYGHVIRYQVLLKLRELCPLGFQDYQRLLAEDPQPSEWDFLSVAAVQRETVVIGLTSNIARSLRSRVAIHRDRIAQTLVQESSACANCRVRTLNMPNGVLATDHADPTAAVRRRRPEVILTNRGAGPRTSDRPHTPPRTPTPDNSANINIVNPDFQQLIGQIEDEEEVEFMAHARPVKRLYSKRPNYTQLALNRFPRPIDPVILEEPTHPLWLAFKDDFDEYHYQVPTVEDFPPLHDWREIPKQLDMFYVLNQSTMTKTFLHSSWSRFTDRGYRILPAFGHSFYLQQAYKPCDHVLTVGLNLAGSSRQQHPSLSQYSLSRNKERRDSVVRVTDIHTMGLQDMFKVAPTSGEGLSHDVFLRGRVPTSTGKKAASEAIDSEDSSTSSEEDEDKEVYIEVDLEHDAVRLPLESVELTVDVDSFIWVTRNVKTNLSVKIFSGPIVGRRAPLWKSNHMYTHVLSPPSELEVDGMNRSWLEERIPLSCIPHFEWAKIIDGTGSVSVYIFFPRMIHRDEYTRRRVTLVPHEVQLMFWNQVINPAIWHVVGEGSRMSYLAYTAEEHQKMRGGKKASRPKAFPFQQADFVAIQDQMKEIIEDLANPALHRYGSHFYVVEAKGIKLQTKVSVSTHTSHASDHYFDPWDALQQEFPQLDFPHMVDRRHGEFVVDIGCTFHPMAEQPLVGLWKLAALEASFGAGGFNRGNLHNIGMLSEYGGLQAEMPEERARHSHVLFRSAYGLQYEAIRSVDNHPHFAEDGDAFSLNYEYNEECNRRIELYEGSASRTSYGVRDEYRMGGDAAMNVLQHCGEMVSELLPSVT